MCQCDMRNMTLEFDGFFDSGLKVMTLRYFCVSFIVGYGKVISKWLAWVMQINPII